MTLCSKSIITCHHLREQSSRMVEVPKGRRPVPQPSTTSDQHPAGAPTGTQTSNPPRPEPLPFFAPNDQALSLEGLRNADPKLRSSLLGDTWDPNAVKAKRIVIFLLSVRNGKGKRCNASCVQKILSKVTSFLK